jgi:AcrR family transcriptional regulator
MRISFIVRPVVLSFDAMIMATTRQDIMLQGLDLLSVRGLDASTLGVLAQRVGLSKSGLFAHFKSKDELQLALLDQSARTADRLFVAPAMSRQEGLPRLRALVKGWLGWTTRAGLSGGCPLSAGMFEYDDQPNGRVRRRLLHLERKWRELLGALTQEAVDLGHLTDHLDIDQFVWELCGIYLSHHVSLRFVRDRKATRRAVTAFNALVERSK